MSTPDIDERVAQQEVIQQRIADLADRYLTDDEWEQSWPMLASDAGVLIERLPEDERRQLAVDMLTLEVMRVQAGKNLDAGT